jgi:alpha-beta hydrolase superfamily lysophospholipase
MIHGATIASALWDNAAPGWSWMDILARAGFHAFALDLRGYGLSSRPASLYLPDAPPFARAVEVQADLCDTIAFIRDLTRADQVDLLGGSWGSVVCGLFASGPNARQVRRLVLYAPLYSAKGQGADWCALAADPEDPERLNPRLGAVRPVHPNDFRRRWASEIPVADKASWRDSSVVEALIHQSLEEAAHPQCPGAFAVPNGSVADLFEVFHGRPLYSAAQINMPTLLLRGEFDPTSTHEDAMSLFTALGSERKRYCVIGRGAHFMIAERCLPEVHGVIAAFLSEAIDSLVQDQSHKLLPVEPRVAADRIEG